MRSRYLDLIVRDQARETVVRAREGQRLACARPSPTAATSRSRRRCCRCSTAAHPLGRSSPHSNAFDTELYLRIAPELFLKRAVVGGIDRVFEINRNFRNEGADSTHSPEFAMLEAYEAYSDYNGIADLTQDAHPERRDRGRRLDDRDLGRRHRVRPRRAVGPHLDVRLAVGGIRPAPSPRRPRSTSCCALAAEAGVEAPPLATHGKLVEELWEHFVKGGLTRPTFVMDFPLDTSPLVREHRSIAGVVEKWDLYVRGFELATGYSELVDPVIQRERFTEQAKLAARGDLEAMRIDEEFLRALEHGMPPSGGLGMGIDRLLMAITGLGIRETILFPLVK